MTSRLQIDSVKLKVSIQILRLMCLNDHVNVKKGRTHIYIQEAKVQKPIWPSIDSMQK